MRPAVTSLRLTVHRNAGDGFAGVRSNDVARYHLHDCRWVVEGVRRRIEAGHLAVGAVAMNGRVNAVVRAADVADDGVRLPD